MKELLICPHCAQHLLKEEKRYACANGHSFDIARQGYVNLLCGKGGSHGDNALMIEARRRFLEKGFYAPLADGMAKMLRKYARQENCLLDIGCGEGYYTQNAREALADKSPYIIAFDISKEALKYAARRHIAEELFVASAYKMPVRSQSIDIAMLFFSPFCREEIFRVLKEQGLLLMAYPADAHLYGLKRALYDTPYPNRPEDPEIAGFSLIDTERIHEQIHLTSKEDIASLFMMTPYYYKTARKDQEKLFALSSLSTEIDFYLRLYRKNYTI